MEVLCNQSKLKYRFSGSDFKWAILSRLLEILVVMIAVIALLRVFAADYSFGLSWLTAPAILISAALIPTLVMGGFPQSGFLGTLSRIGINFRHPRQSLVLLAWVCIVAFPVVLVSFWLLKSYGLDLPLRSAGPQQQSWPAWVVYQFLYVAVAEEMFFRGYVQGGILSRINELNGRSRKIWEFISIVISAGCFGIAHIIVQGQIISGVVFVPGLILGWLFLRSRSLLAPILFHGLANVWYLVIFLIL